MFFSLSKIFWVLVQPLNAIALLLVLGGLTRLLFSEKIGLFLMRAGLTLFLVFGLLPVGPALVTWLERQYPTPQAIERNVDGIIVLGGAFDSYLTAKTGHIVANSQIDRMFCFIELAKQYPSAKLVFSGGPGDIVNPDAMEGNDARAFFDLTGFSDRTIIYEEKSRNTYENAIFSKDLVKPEPSEQWAVTTSAYHMPRTMGIFEAAGWAVTPYQCDPKTDGSYDFFNRLPSISGNFMMLDIAVKEILGSIAYYLSGKTAFIIPPARIDSGP